MKLKKVFKNIILPSAIIISGLGIIFGFIPWLYNTITFNIKHYTIGERIRHNGMEFKMISHDEFVEITYCDNPNNFSKDEELGVFRNTPGEFFAPDSLHIPKVFDEHKGELIAKLVYIDPNLTEIILERSDVTFFFPRNVEGLSNIEKIIIKDVFKLVFDNGFMKGNKSLKIIDISDPRARIKVLTEAFMDCHNLIKVNWNPSFFENVTLGYNAFSNAINLKEIDIELLCPGAFHGCNFDNYLYDNELFDDSTNKTYNIINDCIYSHLNALIYINNDKYLKNYKFIDDVFVNTFSVFPPHRIDFDLSESDIYYFDENDFIMRKKYQKMKKDIQVLKH